MSKMHVSSSYLEKGRTKLLPVDESSVIPVQISLWKEVWVKETEDLKGHVRSLYAEIRFGDDHVVVSEVTVDDLLRRVGLVLLALTKRR